MPVVENSTENTNSEKGTMYKCIYHLFTYLLINTVTQVSKIM